MGSGHTVSASFTRPSDTTTYASGDVFGDGANIVFKRANRGAGEAAIIQQLVMTSSAYVAAGPALELWLFDTAIGVDADNAAFTPTDAELATLVGIATILTTDWKPGTATVGAGGNMAAAVANLSIPFNCTGSVNDLYGVFVVRSAYVPVSAEAFTVRLMILD